MKLTCENSLSKRARSCRHRYSKRSFLILKKGNCFCGGTALLKYAPSCVDETVQAASQKIKINICWSVILDPTDQRTHADCVQLQNIFSFACWFLVFVLLSVDLSLSSIPMYKTSIFGLYLCRHFQFKTIS